MRSITIWEGMTVAELCLKLGRSTSHVIKSLLNQDVFATPQTRLTLEQSTSLAIEFHESFTVTEPEANAGDEVARAAAKARHVEEQALLATIQQNQKATAMATHGGISPRGYLVGQALAGLIAQTGPHGYSLDEISTMGGLAIDIADATLDAMTWPNGKPEEKR